MRYLMTVAAICLGLQLFGQGMSLPDSVQIKGSLADTVQLAGASVTTQGAARQVRQGAYSASAVDIGAQAATLQSLSQVINRTSGIRIRTQGGAGSEFELSVNGLSVSSIRYFIDGVALSSLVYMGEAALTAAAIVAIFCHGGVLLSAQVYAGLITPQEAFYHQPPYGGLVNINL